MTQSQRWVRFNLVGVAGFAVQLLTLAALTRWLHLPIAVAVSVAVFAAVSHNFLWHERLTWPDRPPHRRVIRWLAFNLSNGLVSLLTNVIVTTVIVATTTAPLYVANAAAVAAASVLNFLISDHFVFDAPGGRL